MKIFYRPLKRWVINQKYGLNTVCIDNATSSKYERCDGLNPPEGWRSIYGPKGHTGLDLNANYWTPIVAMREGRVYDIDTNKRSGYDVRIETIIDGRKYQHIYEHMEKWSVKKGQQVRTGQLIGYVGSTGYSTGPHLHLEIRDEDGQSIDPETIIDTKIYAADVYKISEAIPALVNKLNILKGSLARYIAKG